jgi:hypothetical protein
MRFNSIQPMKFFDASVILSACGTRAFQCRGDTGDLASNNFNIPKVENDGL